MLDRAGVAEHSFHASTDAGLLKSKTLPGDSTAKLIFDRVFALLFLIAFGPLIALIALLVRLDSPGPIF
ncbi:MAG: hypothetical protein ACPGVJ_09245, partial [Mangrovicoccus sp.]